MEQYKDKIVTQREYIHLKQCESTENEKTKSTYSRLIPENECNSRHNTLPQKCNGNK